MTIRVPRKTGIARQAFGTSTVNCLCSDCKTIPGHRVSISNWDAHVAWHAANGLDPYAAPSLGPTVLGPTYATLSWSPPVYDPGLPILGYRVARDGTDSNGTGAWSDVLPSDVRTITFTALKAGLTYNLTVCAVTARGNEGVAKKAATIAASPVTPPAPEPSASKTPYLAFDLDYAKLAASPRKIGPHEWPPIARTVDNAVDWRNDYIARHLLNPTNTAVTGYNGKPMSDYGGSFRDRPFPWEKQLPFDPADQYDQKSATWRLMDSRWNVMTMKEAGFDFCAIDLMVAPPSGDLNQVYNTRAMMKAGNELDFPIMLEYDQLQRYTATQIAAYVKELAANKSAYRLPDGRLLFTAFGAELVVADRSAASVIGFWKPLIAAIEAQVGKIAFLPTFLDERPYRQGIKDAGWYGTGIWGSAAASWNNPDPALVSNPDSQQARAKWCKDNGLVWFQPSRIQDVRPREGRYWECDGSLLMRNTLKIAAQNGIWLVQTPTWTDYYEGAYLCPSIKDGHGWLDLYSHYLAEYKLGAMPTVTRDVAYLLHRPMSINTQPRLGYPVRFALDHPSAGHVAKDYIEAHTFLREADTITPNWAPAYQAPAGPFVKMLPFKADITPTLTTGRGKRCVSSTPTVSAADVQDFRVYCHSSERELGMQRASMKLVAA